MRTLVLALLLGAQDAEWWLVASDGAAVREDGKAQKKVDAPAFAKPLSRGYTGCVPSPDGKKLAYVESDGDTEIWVCDADGGKTKRLTDNRSDDGYPSWTADAKILFASNRSGTYQVYEMKADGSAVKELTSESGGAWEPAIAADGALAYGADSTSPKIVLRMGEVTVSVPCSFPSEPAWSPDGSKLAFVTGSDVVLVDRKGKEVRRTAMKEIVRELDGWKPHQLAWRPDGAALACRVKWEMRKAAPADEGRDRVIVLPLEGTGRRLELGGAPLVGWKK